MNVLLKPAELLYQAVNRARRTLYRRGVLKGKKLPRPVVSVGNLSVGGSGKTPTTIAVANLLQSVGYRVAILSRGYGRSGGDEWSVVTSTDARHFGDEPVMLAARLPGCRVVVGGDRYVAGIGFLASFDCDVFVLDDGFQHLQLQRDVDVVIVDPAARWNRESRSALQDADIRLLRTDSHSLIHQDETAPFHATLVATGYRHGATRGPLSGLRGMRCVAMSALARNDRFFQMLEKEGVEVVGRHGFRDHHLYSEADLAEVRASKDRLEAELILTTEKDAGKLPAEFDCAIIEVNMNITPEDSFRSTLLERLPSPPAPGVR